MAKSLLVMNQNHAFLTLSILIVFFFNSCSISKRYHNSGLHFDFRFSSENVEEINPTYRTKRQLKDTTTAIEFIKDHVVSLKFAESSQSELKKTTSQKEITSIEKILKTDVKTYAIIKTQTKNNNQASSSKKKAPANEAKYLETSIVTILGAVLLTFLTLYLFKAGIGTISFSLGLFFMIIVYILLIIGIISLITWLGIKIVKAVRKSKQSDIEPSQ